jgi:hypothetical protein
LASFLLLGCPAESDPATPGTTDGSESGASMSSGTTIDPDSSTSDPASSSSDSSSGTTMGPLQACGLEDLNAGAADPIEAGTRAMQIPPDIATILVDNCGCHLTDDFTVADVPNYPESSGFDMTTWTGWQGTHPATGSTYYDMAFNYIDQNVMPLMPFCSLPMDLSQRETLGEWLTQGAPDGATWVP